MVVSLSLLSTRSLLNRIKTPATTNAMISTHIKMTNVPIILMVVEMEVPSLGVGLREGNTKEVLEGVGVLVGDSEVVLVLDAVGV